MTKPCSPAPTHSPAAALLRRYCRESGTSMRALSQAIGRGEKYVADICSGRSRYPDHEALRALAVQTGLEFAALAPAADRERTLAATVRAGLYMDAVLNAVAADQTLPPATRDKRYRNIAVFCRTWLKRAPETVPADARWLSEAIRAREWGPAALGISEKRFSDVLSSVRCGLVTVKAVPRPGKPIEAVRPAWRALYERVRGSWLAPALSPFIRYCDTIEVAPEAVDDTTAETYRHLRDRYDLSTQSTERKLAKLRAAWNAAVDSVDGWPATRITLGARQRLTLPHDLFPASFWASREAYRTNRGVPGHAALQSKCLLERARARRPPHAGQGQFRRHELTPLGDTTLARQRGSLHLLAFRAVDLGLVTADELTNIGDVADPTLVAHMIAEDIRPRLGLATGYGDTLVKHMASIARRWVPGITANELEDFSLLRRELDGHRENSDGLSPRDRRRLASFLSDVEAMAKLVSLPAWVVELNEQKRQRNGHVSPEMAREVRAAVAVLLEQTLPVRWGDLTCTQFDVNVIPPARPGAPGILFYRVAKTRKSGRREQHATFAPWKVRLLDLYRRHYVPRLIGNDRANPHVFPGDLPDRPTAQLDKQVRALVLDWLGYVINPHLWRKLMAGYLLLQTDDLAMVADLLGHVRGSEATNVYVEMKLAWAAKHLDARVTALASQTQMPDEIRRRIRRRDL